MKAIVVPTGAFMYMTNEPGISIVPERPVLVRVDEFIRTLKLTSKIEALSDVVIPDEATDAEWKLWFHETGGSENSDLAVESFLKKWSGLDEKSLAQQALETNARMEQEAREKAEAEALAAQQQLLAEVEAKKKLEAEAAKTLAEAEKLAEEKRAAEVKAAAEKKEGK
jgi:uncharacterized protein with von Willebrand factor type A (vWA) domain